MLIQRWLSRLGLCFALVANCAFATALFSDTTFVPPYPSTGTVIQTGNHGYWVITDFSTGYSPPTGHLESVQVYDDAGTTKFAFTNGTTISVIPLPDPSPMLDSATLPSIIGPDTLLTMASGSIWDVIDKAGGGGASWSAGTHEPVLFYRDQGRQLMAFLTHGGNYEVQPFSLPTTAELIFVPPYPSTNTVIQTGSRGYWLITNFSTGYSPPTGVFTTVLMFVEGGDTKFAFTNGTTISVIPLPDPSPMLDLATLPSIIGPDTLLTMANGSVWDVIGDAGGGGASWSAGTREPVLFYRDQGRQLMAFLTHGGNYEVVPFSAGKTNQTITFGAAPTLSMGGNATIFVSGGGSGNLVILTSLTPGICSVAGNTVNGLAAGICMVAANQVGNATYADAIQVVLRFNVRRTTQTITFNAISEKTYGGPSVALSAMASSGLAVTFVSITPAICTANGSVATLIAAGTCTITASQSGNANFEPAAVVTQSFNITRGAQTIGQITSNPETLIYGSSGTFSVAATASSALSIAFSSLTPQVCTVNGSTVTVVGVGTCTIAANQGGTGNYSPALQVVQNFSILTPGSSVLLRVVPKGTGIGTVTSNPPGIVCGADCNESYPAGTGVTLTANAPHTGSAFSHWGGACVGSGSCTVMMSSAKNVTATFVYLGSVYSYDYVQKAFVAYYGRPADPGGQAYWAGRMDAEGQSLNAIIGAFGNSAEFNGRYGGLSYADLVTKIYQQALGRDPDPAGLDWYVAELVAGRRTLQTITLDVLNGATTAPDSTVVANKLDVAAYYTAKVAAGCLYGTEQDGGNIISGVTAISATVTAAKAGIDTRCGP